MKALYAICYSNPNYFSCEFDYNSKTIVNKGVAYALKEKFYSYYVPGS